MVILHPITGWKCFIDPRNFLMGYLGSCHFQAVTSTSSSCVPSLSFCHVALSKLWALYGKRGLGTPVSSLVLAGMLSLLVSDRSSRETYASRDARTHPTGECWTRQPPVIHDRESHEKGPTTAWAWPTLHALVVEQSSWRERQYFAEGEPAWFEEEGWRQHQASYFKRPKKPIGDHHIQIHYQPHKNNTLSSPMLLSLSLLHAHCSQCSSSSSCHPTS